MFYRDLAVKLYLHSYVNTHSYKTYPLSLVYKFTLISPVNNLPVILA